jgi:hypothetical protein
MPTYNEIAYKKTYNHSKLEKGFRKRTFLKSHICKFADEKSASNEGRQCLVLLSSPKPSANKSLYRKNLTRSNQKVSILILIRPNLLQKF